MVYTDVELKMQESVNKCYGTVGKRKQQEDQVDGGLMLAFHLCKVAQFTSDISIREPTGAKLANPTLIKPPSSAL